MREIVGLFRGVELLELVMITPRQDRKYSNEMMAMSGLYEDMVVVVRRLKGRK